MYNNERTRAPQHVDARVGHLKDDDHPLTHTPNAVELSALQHQQVDREAASNSRPAGNGGRTRTAWPDACTAAKAKQINSDCMLYKLWRAMVDCANAHLVGAIRANDQL